MRTIHALFIVGLMLVNNGTQSNEVMLQPAAESVCFQKKSSGHRSVDIAWALCNKDGGPKADSFFISDEKVKRTNDPKKVKIRDYDTCRTGFEKVAGCNSNPDIKPCKDQSLPIIRQVINAKDDSVLRSFSVCPEDPETELPNNTKVVDVIRITTEQFRSFPLKASRVNSDPSNFSLRNGFTHFWASSNKQYFKVDIAESKVSIRAIPVQWIWNYGDGTTRRLNYPGEPAPEHTLHDKTDTSHVYQETGKFQVVVTTLYRGEFSVDGGPWEPIPGQASVPSEPSVMDVWRTKKELIATD